MIALDAFENRGWEIYRVGELASFILRGGVNFSSMTDSEGVGRRLACIIESL